MLPKIKPSLTSPTLDAVWQPAYMDTILNLEKLMGNIYQEDLPFSYAKAVSLDEQDAFPTEACQQLDAWGLSQYYVPTALGGKLSTFETLFNLIRIMSRRDLTIAIGHAKTFLGISPIWVAGSQAQKELAAKLIINQSIASLGLTEKDHGSDLTANALTAEKTSQGYTLSGEKWLINNATRGDLIILFAKTSNHNPARNHSLFLVQKKNLDADSYAPLPKIKTHGIRGADISGIQFKAALVDDNALIAKEGLGLEITLKSLQISRTLCASLSLGAADTAFRTTMTFVQKRTLYQKSITDIPYVKELITDAFLDIIICEAVSLFAIRCLHIRPELMSLYSSVVKYLVPTKVEALFDSLASVLGARFYLREELEHGIFQKALRDNGLVGLFDGSTIVNLQNIANQINAVIRKSKEIMRDISLLNDYKKIFSLNVSVDALQEEKLSLLTRGIDFIPSAFESLAEQIKNDKINYPDKEKLIILRYIKIIIAERDRLFDNISKKSYFLEKIDKEKEENLSRYCQIFAASCITYMLHINPELSNDFMPTSTLLVHCLARIVSEFNHDSPLVYEDSLDMLWGYVEELHRSNRLFSLTPIQLGGSIT